MTDSEVPESSVVVIQRLSDEERTAFKDLEGQVAKWRVHLMDGVVALEEIKARKLYREQFPTFEDYCKRKWGKSARQMVDRLEACLMRNELLEQTTGEFPGSETSIDKAVVEAISDSAALELKPVKPEKRAAILNEAAAKNPKPTAKDIREQVQRSKHKPVPGRGQFSEPEPRKLFNPYGSGDAAPATDKKAVAQQAVSSLDYRKRLLAAFDDVCESNSDDWCLSRQAIDGLRTALEAVEI